MCSTHTCDLDWLATVPELDLPCYGWRVPAGKGPRDSVKRIGGCWAERHAPWTCRPRMLIPTPSKPSPDLRGPVVKRERAWRGTLQWEATVDHVMESDTCCSHRMTSLSLEIRVPLSES